MSTLFKIYKFRAQASILQTRGQWRCILILLLVFWLFFAACPAYCTDYYVAPDGNDLNDGSIDHPFKTITKAMTMVAAGDTIYLRGGEHRYSAKVSVTRSGTAGPPINPITMQNYQNETVIVDFNDEPIDSSNRGISLSGNYWHFKGFTIRYAGDNGLYVTGSYNILEQLVTYGNADSGLQLFTGASYNQVINCDSYCNYDAVNHGENADGFAAKGNTGCTTCLGPGNEFHGCRAWNNSDDGFDLWWANNAVRIENCWAFRNGVNIWGDTAFEGDGQGIKLGQGGGAHIVIHCMSYNNQYCGFDENRSTTDTTGLTLYNCTGVNNLDKNFNFSNPVDGGIGAIHVLRNNISHLGSVNIGTLIDDTYNSWNDGFTVSDSDFASLDPNGIDGPRGPNGELPKLRFLRLAPDSLLIDVGIDVNQPFYGDAPDLGAFEHLDGDCEPDGDVDFADFACLASNWLNSGCGTCNGADFDGDSTVNWYDLAVMTGNWLK